MDTVMTLEESLEEHFRNMVVPYNDKQIARLVLASAKVVRMLNNGGSINDRVDLPQGVTWFSSKTLEGQNWCLAWVLVSMYVLDDFLNFDTSTEIPIVL